MGTSDLDKVKAWFEPLMKHVPGMFRGKVLGLLTHANIRAWRQETGDDVFDEGLLALRRIATGETVGVP